MEGAGVVLWVLLAWIVLNALIVVVWTGVGRFAKRAPDPARRGLRAEALFAVLAFVLIFGGGSLASPSVRHAVKEAVFSATGLGASGDASEAAKRGGAIEPPVGTQAFSGGDGSGGSQAAPRPTSKEAGSGTVSSPSPSPTEEPSPSPTEEPSPSPTEEPSPSPTEEPSPSPTEEPTAQPSA